MNKIVSFYTALVALLSHVLQGEPLRVITYGGASVVWLVSNIAWTLGYQTFGAPINFDVALLAATAAVVAITEAERRFVFSPNTVIDILSEVPTQVPDQQGEPIPPDPHVVPTDTTPAPAGDTPTT